MKKLIAALSLLTVVSMPAMALARDVTLTTELSNYGGDGAYLALYLTDVDGNYHKTLWIAGTKSKYYKHLRDWARGSGQNQAAGRYLEDVY